MNRLLLLSIGPTIFLSSCGSSAPVNVAATVNGRSITYAELDKQYESQFGALNERPNDDQVVIQRLEVLRTLIDNEIMLQRAEKMGLLAVDSDVDAKFTEMKAPYTQEEFQKQLASRKVTAEELKAQLRRDLTVQKLFNKEITSQISISDNDITEFYNSNRNSFNLAEPQIHMAQILVTPLPDPNVHNLKNDKAQSEEQARNKIQQLYQRLRQGEADPCAMFRPEDRYIRIDRGLKRSHAGAHDKHGGKEQGKADRFGRRHKEQAADDLDE